MEHWAYEADHDAERSFLQRSPEDQALLMFKGLRSVLQKLDGVNSRLDVLNSTTADTKDKLAGHLQQHRDQHIGYAFLEVIGSRVLAVGVGCIVIIGGLGTVLQIISFFKA